MNFKQLLQHYTNTTEWASAQDRIFAGKEDPRVVLGFTALHEAQERICPTNLTIRQNMILAGIYGPGGKGSIAHFLGDAMTQFAELRRDEYWAESASYFGYTAEGLRWYEGRGTPLPEGLYRMWQHTGLAYDYLVAPTGEIPLPECRRARWSLREDLPDVVDVPGYYVRRWYNEDRSKVLAYLLVSKRKGGPLYNLHHHLEAGYAAFWTARDGWLLRCRPYEGFNLEESLTSASLAATLPPGALTPMWRLRAPSVKVKTQQLLDLGNARRFLFTWSHPFGDARREILIDAEGVTITDTPAGIFTKAQRRRFKI